MNKNSAYMEFYDVEYQEINYSWEQWMDYFSQKNNEDAFQKWLKDRWLFATDYLVIEEDNIITIANKKTYQRLEFAKIRDSFVIEFEGPDKVKNKKIFGFGEFEVSRKVKV